MTRARTRGMPRRTEQVASRRRMSPVVLIGGVIVLVVIAAIVAAVLSGGGGGAAASEPGPAVSVSGQTLAALPQGGADPAVGQPIPKVTGARLNGEGNLTIDPADGKAKVIMLLAHWCPHCQAEVTRLSPWLAGDPLPANVEVIAVATSIDRARPNFPPSEWLKRENFNEPTMVDDASSTALQAFGISSFPGWVFVNSDGTIMARTTGELEVAQVQQLISQLR